MDNERLWLCWASSSVLLPRAPHHFIDSPPISQRHAKTKPRLNARMDKSKPALSVIVVFYNMHREAPRTLYTLSNAYQNNVSERDYEVIAVDNGSLIPLKSSVVESFGSNFRLLRTEGAPSPCAAINAASQQARGEIVMVSIDGARMLSPGIVSLTLNAFLSFTDPIVATIALHLGPWIQNESMMTGYNQKVEDELLETIDWRGNGYKLFTVSCLAGSSSGGFFLPLNESNCLSVKKSSLAKLGGFDEKFISPGGGLVNLDFYKRACEALDQLVVLLGEGTFHQFHGGVATNVPPDQHPWNDFHAEYVAIRGESFSPSRRVPLILGSVERHSLPFLTHSVQALEAEQR